MLQAPLEHTGAGIVARYVVNVSSKDVDESESFRCNPFDQFLDHLQRV
jgi:hypothetical protein